MSSQDNDLGERRDGTEAASSSKPDTPSSSTDNINESMKRAAVKQQIERFYYQITDGCGKPNCSNDTCASSSNFIFKNLSRNDAGLKAIQLFKDKAEMCDFSKPSKVAKSSVDEGAGVGSSSTARVLPSSGAVAQTSTSSITHKSISSVQATTGASSPSKTSPQKQAVKPDTPFLTESKLHALISECESLGDWTLLRRTVGSIFSNPDALVLSFRKEAEPAVAAAGPKTKEELHVMDVDLDKDIDEQEDITLASGSNDNDDDLAGVAVREEEEDEDGVEGDGSPSSSQAKVKLKDDEVTVDVDSVRRAYTELFAIPDQPFEAALSNALIYLSRAVELDLKYHRPFEKDADFLNHFIVIFEIPHLDNVEYIESATPLFYKLLGLMPVEAQAKLVRMWSKYSLEQLKSKVESLQQMITVKVISSPWTRGHNVNDDEGITGAARVMKLYYYACILAGRMDEPSVIEDVKSEEGEDDHLQDLLGAVSHEPKEKSPPKEDPLEKQLGIQRIDCRQPVLDWDDFINEPLSDAIEMDKDYTNYRTEDQSKFSFMTHSFLLTTAVKNLGMYFDNRIRMMNERRTSLFQSLVHGAPTSLYLKLRIRRDHIIDDALVALEMAAMDNPADLKKQLYVEFDGEQGIDEGGVSKEFFQLVVEELFNPDIGMFTYNEDTHTFWFNPTSFENDGQFTLIGIILGLAIYNNVILDIHYPMVVYRKLMGKKGTLEDLMDSHPVLARSLQQMLDYEGSVEETFMHTFQIGYKDVFGNTLTHDLIPNGDKVPVTNDSRKEFVERYADFLLNKSVERQFKAFRRGFKMVTEESPLKMLFRPEEVELLVCGSKQFDFHALEDSTDYDGGFTSDSPAIRNFWSVVHDDCTEDQKRKLLQFTTGSDRVPVGGLSKLKLIIAKNGPDSDRLPTAHTCFNVLLLPDYDTRDKLLERLLKAINYAKGFGML